MFVQNNNIILVYTVFILIIAQNTKNTYKNIKFVYSEYNNYFFSGRWYIIKW